MDQAHMLWEKEAEIFGADLNRVQVWDAFSQFYLDTELSVTDLERIDLILARSPFSVQELQHIDVFEVRPVCADNLLSVAGVWGCFSPEWLIQRCQKQQIKRPFRPADKQTGWQKLLMRTFYRNFDAARIEEMRAHLKNNR